MQKKDDALLLSSSRTNEETGQLVHGIARCTRRSRRIGLALGGLVVATWITVFRTHIMIDSLAVATHVTNGDVRKKVPDVRHASVPLPKPTKASWTIDPNSSWYGWQPEINTEPDCTWRSCFKVNHGCRTTCRDEPEAMGQVPLKEDVPHDWVPDVTMLRRMFLAQKDANGNPWPPPLPTELCEPIGNDGDSHDQDKELLDAAPIIAEPLLGTEGGGPKILCMIYTMASAHAAQVRAIRETWAGGCDGFLAFSTESDPRIPAISIPHDGDEHYKNMWQKVRSIWRYVDEHYVDHFDFFILGGDDLFLLPQNLRSYLDTVGSPDEPLYAGRKLRHDRHNIYNSGGAGYTLSRGMLKLFAKHGLNDTRCEPERRTSTEDVMVARCLRLVFGIGLMDTRDDQGRERFHPFPPGWHFHWTPTLFRRFHWFYQQTLDFGIKRGAECCSTESVSFHYLRKPAVVRHLFSLLYDSKCQLETGDARKTADGRLRAR